MAVHSAVTQSSIICAWGGADPCASHSCGSLPMIGSLIQLVLSNQLAAKPCQAKTIAPEHQTLAHCTCLTLSHRLQQNAFASQQCSRGMLKCMDKILNRSVCTWLLVFSYEALCLLSDCVDLLLRELQGHARHGLGLAPASSHLHGCLAKQSKGFSGAFEPYFCERLVVMHSWWSGVSIDGRALIGLDYTAQLCKVI